jgi:hypothetical protein
MIDFFILRIKKQKEILCQKRGRFWGDCKEHGLNIVLAKSIIKGRQNHAKGKRQKA